MEFGDFVPGTMQLQSVSNERVKPVGDGWKQRVGAPISAYGKEGMMTGQELGGRVPEPEEAHYLLRRPSPECNMIKLAHLKGKCLRPKKKGMCFFLVPRIVEHLNTG